MPIDKTLIIQNFHVGDTYTRKTVADTGQVSRPKQDRDWSGIVSFENCILLFVTLDKTNFEESNQYHDVFDRGGTEFYWDSQSRNTVKTPAIARIIGGDIVIVFVRIASKVRGKTQPFTYVGKLGLRQYEGEKPVQMVFDVLDHMQNPPKNLQEIYEWEPEGERKLRPIETEVIFTTKAPTRRKQPGSGQGRLLDPAKKKAIELRAMAVAESYYREQHFEVEDTSKNSPYDLLCKKGEEERKVEVKGTTQEAKSVNVTANEVDSACDDNSVTDLFVVYNITVYKKSADYRAEGGEIRIVDNWVPEQDNLSATQYIYRLPD